MGRTILYILIGISVVGALAVLLLITPVPNEPAVSVESTNTADVTSAPADVQETTTADANTGPQAPEAASTTTEEAASVTAPETTPADAPQTASAAVAYAIDGTIVSGEYPHETSVAGVKIYWGNSATELRVGLVSPGTGFVAIGFDPDRQMEGANIIIGAVHEGELTIRDDYGFEPFAHMEDTARGGTDDIIAAAGNEWPDQTVIEFIIPLDSGDPMDKPLLPGHEYNIIAAYHSLLDSFGSPHTSRGSGTIQLDLPS
jgi:hypothetical protein